MNKETLYEIINSKSEKLSSAAIKDILNEELDKSPEEMDTDLVDLCLDALENIQEIQQNKRTHHIKFTRILTAAVIFMLVIGVSIPACAKFFDADLPDGIVTVYEDYLDIDLKGGKYIRHIDTKLEQDGFNGEFLPSIFYTGEAKVFNYKTQQSSFDSYARFDFSYNDTYGSVSTTRYDDERVNFSGEHKIHLKEAKVEYFEYAGFKGVVCSNDELVMIYYYKDLTEYTIQITGDMESAAEIADEFLN